MALIVRRNMLWYTYKSMGHCRTGKNNPRDYGNTVFELVAYDARLSWHFLLVVFLLETRNHTCYAQIPKACHAMSCVYRDTAVHRKSENESFRQPA
jgi:hypothetical protein